MNRLVALIFIGVFIIMPSTMFSQRTISGVIFDENNTPIPGAIIKNPSDSLALVSDLEGRFSFQTNDTTGILFFVIDLLDILKKSYVNLHMGQPIREIIDIENRDSIKCKLKHVNNTITKRPKTKKWDTLTNNGYIYKLKYCKQGKLSQVYMIDKQKKGWGGNYVWDIKYYKGYITIVIYILEQSDSLKKEEKFYLSQVNFYYDMKGAIRKRSVSDEYGSHHEQYNELYFYKSNKISEVLSYEYIKDWFYVNPEKFYYQNQMMLEIIQNEIFRRKIYRKSKGDGIFSTDYKIELID